MLTSRSLTFSKGWRPLLTIAALLLVLGAAVETAAQAPHTAGLVVRHGDGTIIYALVQFEEESITGTELLERSEIDVVMAPYGGMGVAVCSLDGEGCASDNCFCHSYSSPSFYWHYYVQTGDDWSEHPLGPSSRHLSDGDVDGWSWTAGESKLSEITIEDIVELNAPPLPTSEPEQTGIPEQQPSPTVESESRAVVVAPGESPTALVSGNGDGEGSANTYLAFAAMAALVAVAGGFAAIRQRKAAP
ncbi:hypothetical protein BH23CHL1_BH23CHL1_26390 [soil metagenome]